MSESYLSVVLVLETNVHQTSLRAMLDSTSLLKVVGVARGCLSALQFVQEVHPDFVLIAANLPEAEIVSFLKVVQDETPKTRVVVLRKIPWQRSHFLDAGASAVLSQDSSVSELLAAFTSEST
jgi:DNA-binding NarL/FixJ family response regulator